MYLLMSWEILCLRLQVILKSGFPYLKKHGPKLTKVMQIFWVFFILIKLEIVLKYLRLLTSPLLKQFIFNKSNKRNKNFGNY